MSVAAEIIDRLRHVGLTVFTDGRSVSAGPVELLTDDLRAAVRQHRDEVIAHLLGADLAHAIDRACAARDDPASYRAALQAEAARMSASHRRVMLTHFAAEAAIARATGPARREARKAADPGALSASGRAKGRTRPKNRPEGPFQAGADLFAASGEGPARPIGPQATEAENLSASVRCVRPGESAQATLFDACEPTIRPADQERARSVDPEHGGAR